ncbi:hypothetical protein BegalDRAFT_2916 [Beggiatoa alba B18LD]|uniref:Uncharacterized protein n=1 Tax=Beggiatoa alba B18LD TaxID=395493 RepID=I3CJF1_9GAMM|nr:hypothetical protein [Beggiatoa alba]EIJ43744.1 hypothetical protein BegalDRAFT_2916 [Beggiatoa alba B18LD]
MSYRIITIVPLLFSMGNVYANDYPTIDKVNYVFECMALHGGESYENMYQCACTIDEIANKMSYDEYTKADTLARLLQARGERAAIFRDPPEAKALRKKFADIKTVAEKRCFINQVTAPSHPTATSTTETPQPATMTEPVPTQQAGSNTK